MYVSVKDSYDAYSKIIELKWNLQDRNKKKITKR